MDYLDYFGLAEEPFSHAPLPRFYFASQQHTHVLRRLQHVAQGMKGLGVLVGDIGLGKTTLARRMLDTLPEAEFEAALIVIVHAGVEPDWLLKRIAIQLGVTQPADDKTSLLAQLYHRLVHIYESGRRAVVLIDEAQMLKSRSVMEEIRGLLNLEVPGQKLISFVLFGLPQLEDALALDPPLRQRVALRCHMQSLGVPDTAQYVRHRLQLAAGQDGIFAPDALVAVHRWTRGVPRLINTLCDNVLMELYFAQQRVADAAFVAQVAKDLAMDAPPPVAAAAPPVVAPEHAPGAAQVAAPAPVIAPVGIQPDPVVPATPPESHSAARKPTDIEDPLAFLLKPLHAIAQPTFEQGALGLMPRRVPDQPAPLPRAAVDLDEVDRLLAELE